MKFKIKCKDEGAPDSEAWYEEYIENTLDPEQWAAETLAYFNRTLRPGERKRQLLGVVVDTEDDRRKHDWCKRTDGQSRVVRGRVADLFRCNVCGVTGKRFGLSSSIVLDSKYRAKKYQYCGPPVD